MRELFIYYRLHAAGSELAAVAAAVASFQAALRAAHPGLQTRVLRRPVRSPHDEQTWMETYAYDAPAPLPARGVSLALQAEIEALATAALAPWLQGPRHVEVFEPCA